MMILLQLLVLLVGLATAVLVKDQLVLLKQLEPNGPVYVLLEASHAGVNFPSRQAEVPPGDNAARVALHLHTLRDATGGILKIDGIDPADFFASNVQVVTTGTTHTLLYLLPDPTRAADVSTAAIEAARAKTIINGQGPREETLFRHWYRWDSLVAAVGPIATENLAIDNVKLARSSILRLGDTKESQTVEQEAVLFHPDLVGMMKTQAFVDAVEQAIEQADPVPAPVEIAPTVFMSAQLRSVQGFLPLRVVDGEYYVLLTASVKKDAAEERWGPISKFSNGMPASLTNLLNMCMEAFSLATNVRVPTLGDDPVFLNRRRRLVVLTRTSAEEQRIDQLLAERIDLGAPHEGALAGDNLCAWANCAKQGTMLRWFRLDDLVVGSMATPVDKDDQARLSVRVLHDSELSGPSASSTSILLDQGLQDILRLPTNVATMTQRLLPFREARRSDQMVSTTVLGALVAAIAGFLLPIAVHYVLSCRQK